MKLNINLILASGSPRRKELLENAGYEFRVVVPDESVESAVYKELPPKKYVATASYKKAESIAVNLRDGAVIAADTVAICSGAMLGKPANRQNAGEMLRNLSGTKHSVITGVTVWNVSNGIHVTHVESTLLSMAKLADKEIETYLNSQQWIGKAGAFGYQDGLNWLSIVEGLESNVVGLPIELLPELIDKTIDQAKT